MTPIETLIYWIKERHSIYLSKEQGLPKPWTNDSILRQYRFCNPYRENDAVTKWLKDSWRDENAGDPDLFYNMVVARLINLPDSLAEIGYGATPARVAEVLHDRAKRGLKCLNSAYLVSTNGISMPKPDYLQQRVLQPIWDRRDFLRPQADDTLAQFAARLRMMQGFAGFMVGQVVADMKYYEPLVEADDWWTWAWSGPGSRRGLNRVLGRDKDAPWVESDWHNQLTNLFNIHVNPAIMDVGMPRLHMQDAQNCLCETDKYMRAQTGDGTPKQKYPGLR